jgi:hypothetical protein
MRKINLLIFLLFLILFMTSGCSEKIEQFFKDPDLASIKRVLKITMPLAYASNCAMMTMKGQKPGNVQFIKGGDTSSGCFLMAITVDSTYPLPHGIEATGRILIAGILGGGDMLLMTVIFTELNVSKGTFDIRDISTVPVILDEDAGTGKKELMVVYANEDVNSGSDTLLTVDMSASQVQAEFRRYQNMKLFDGSVIVEQNAWIISVDNGETPANPVDDIYTVSGGGQYVEASSSSGEITQLTMVGMTMTTVCKKNPFEGYAFMQCVKASDQDVEIGHILLSGHSECDGTLKVEAATGVYTLSWGKPVELDLGR